MVRRLPWDGSAPSGALSLRRPRPLMMPVNMDAIVSASLLCRRGGGKRGVRGRCSEIGAARRPGNQAQVGPDALDAGELERQAFGQRGERPEARHLATHAEHQRGQVDEELVDQARPHEGAAELAARLDMQFVDLAPRQVIEHRTEIDLAVGVGTGQDGHALLGQFTDLRRCTAREGAGGVDQSLARRREDAGVERNVELGVDDDTARLQHGVDEPHVEPRVIVDH
eukprot:Opistho-1_new@75752